MFSTKKDELNIFGEVEKRLFYVKNSKRKISNTPEIFTSQQLNSLLEQVNTEKSKDDLLKATRFILKVNGDLVFAKEGVPFQDVPAHFQMTGLSTDTACCFSAGNAYFDNNNFLSIIDHKSGDFKPTFNSLIFVIIKLIEEHVPFNDNLVVHELDNNGAIKNIHAINIGKLIREHKEQISHLGLIFRSIISYEKFFLNLKDVFFNQTNLQSGAAGNFLMASREILNSIEFKENKIEIFYGFIYFLERRYDQANSDLPSNIQAVINKCLDLMNQFKLNLLLNDKDKLINQYKDFRRLTTHAVHDKRHKPKVETHSENHLENKVIKK